MKKILKKKVKGFTLIEMLVVLGIISILLLLFVPNLSKQKQKIQELLILAEKPNNSFDNI